MCAAALGLAVGALLALAGCSLNPQPLPPLNEPTSTAAGDTSGEKGGDAAAVYAAADSGDAGSFDGSVDAPGLDGAALDAIVAVDASAEEDAACDCAAGSGMDASATCGDGG
jgi:hypothetical protein